MVEKKAMLGTPRVVNRPGTLDDLKVRFPALNETLEAVSLFVFTQIAISLPQEVVRHRIVGIHSQRPLQCADLERDLSALQKFARSVHRSLPHVNPDRRSRSRL